MKQHSHLTHLPGSVSNGVRSRMKADLPLFLNRKNEELKGNQKVEVSIATESVNKFLSP